MTRKCFAGCLLLLGCLTVTDNLFGQEKKPKRSRVGVVDFAKAYQNYQKVVDFNKEMNDLLLPFRKAGENLRTEIQSLEKNLREKDDPTARTQWERGIIDRKRKMEDLERDARQKLGRKNEQMVEQSSKDISQAVEKYAKAKGFRLVMAYGERPDSHHSIARLPYTPAIGDSLFPLYVHPSVDITQAVIELLNQEYAASSGSKAGEPKK